MLPRLDGHAIPVGGSSNTQVKKSMNSDQCTWHQFDRLVPIIGSNNKESKSAGPKELLFKLTVTAKLLKFEISAVKIQSFIRRFLANLKVLRLKRRLILFNSITEHCASRYLEEVVLATCLELSLSFIRHNHRFKRLKMAVDTELIYEVEDMIEEHIITTASTIVRETISEVIEATMHKRGWISHDERLKQQQVLKKRSNMLLDLIDSICDEVTDSERLDIVSNAIQEEVLHFLNTNYANMVYAVLEGQVFQEVIPSMLQEVLTICHGHEPALTLPLISSLEDMRVGKGQAQPHLGISTGGAFDESCTASVIPQKQVATYNPKDPGVPSAMLTTTSTDMVRELLERNSNEIKHSHTSAETNIKEDGANPFNKMIVELSKDVAERTSSAALTGAIAKRLHS